MNQPKYQPDLFIYTPDKITCKGSVVEPLSLSVDLNFASLSKMTFNVNKKIYDIEQEKWIDNPCYDNLKKKNLICTTDNNKYIRFLGDKFLDDYDFKGTLTNRLDSSSTYDFNSNISVEWGVYPETEMFDVGTRDGYIWSFGGTIDGKGSFIDRSNNPKNYYNRLACETFFPVETGDILALTSKVDNNTHYGYNVYFYETEDASSYLGNLCGDGYHHIADPVSRLYIDFSEYKSGVTKGYIRISIYNYTATYNEKSDGSSEWEYSYPLNGYIRIFSGERKIKSVLTDYKGRIELPIKWWIINNIDENDNGINRSKTVELFSYEYILANKTFSLEESTLPLYVPDNIYNSVKSNNWIIDVYDDVAYRHPQRINKGLVNQILENIPNWSLGYVSTTLFGDSLNGKMKYRTFDKVDNANIYSFLTNEIQSKFNCFVIFDTENQTINLIAKDDCCDLVTDAILTWDNAVKSLNITNSDIEPVTALRVHTSDDKYGIGLVNPLGTNIIYNFYTYQKDMEYVINQIANRTLYEAATQVLNKTDAEKTEYQTKAKDLISCNLEITKLKTKLSEKLTEYRSKADIINTYLANDFENDATSLNNYTIGDVPRTPASMKSGAYKPLSNYKNYHSKSLYSQLYDLAVAYENVKQNLSDYENQYNTAYNYLKNCAEKASLNYYKVKSGENTKAILSADEIKALDNFIIEGDWRDDGAVFSDTYTVDDIYDTLIDVYNNALQDLNLYSQQNYEFNIELANILKIPELKTCVENIYLGNALHFRDNDSWVTPVLLSIHIDYGDSTNFSMSFSTDYKRKPMDVRFTDLFATIEQTSVSTPSFTFE